jgi:arylsulfatase A
MRDGPWKLVRPFVTRKVNPEDSSEQPVLYNLIADPRELHNVAEENAQKYSTMVRQLDRWGRNVEQDRTSQISDRR